MNLEDMKDRRVMTMSEAAGVHNHLLGVAKTTFEQSLKKLKDTPVGVRRRGPLSRKLIAHLKRSMAPTLIAESATKRHHMFLHASYDEMDVAHPDQLMISAFLFDKKKIDILDHFRMGIVITRHANERLIQYFRVRDVDKLDPWLCMAYAALIEIVKNNGVIEKDESCAVVIEGRILGHFVIGPHHDHTDEKPLMVVKTWIGARSYTPHQLNECKAKGWEVVS
mgnify:CR=1 FL=1